MNAVSVERLGKSYRRYHRDRPISFQEALVKGFNKLLPAEKIWALREVSFDLPRGKMLGVIGLNGAGKSTLLRLLGGVGRPDEGRLIVNGRVNGLLDLGAGFHFDLTGRENVFINGVISGLLKQEVVQCFDDIVEFAELHKVIDEPLRTYSSGMRMRLGFAIAVHTRPEILLIDEVLAVGDISFQKRCFDRILEFKHNGCTIILASHNLEQVKSICDDVLWLDQGVVAGYGDPGEVVDQFLSFVRAGQGYQKAFR